MEHGNVSFSTIGERPNLTQRPAADNRLLPGRQATDLQPEFAKTAIGGEGEKSLALMWLIALKNPP
jgi:hypothetical protein